MTGEVVDTFGGDDDETDVTEAEAREAASLATLAVRQGDPERLQAIASRLLDYANECADQP